MQVPHTLEYTGNTESDYQSPRTQLFPSSQTSMEVRIRKFEHQIVDSGKRKIRL